MPRYHLHLFNSLGILPDTEGIDAVDLDAAQALAVASIRSLLAEEVREGRLDLRGHIEIAESGGKPLAVVAFADAVTVLMPGNSP